MAGAGDSKDVKQTGRDSKATPHDLKQTCRTDGVPCVCMVEAHIGGQWSLPLMANCVYPCQLCAARHFMLLEKLEDPFAFITKTVGITNDELVAAAFEVDVTERTPVTEIHTESVYVGDPLFPDDAHKAREFWHRNQTAFDAFLRGIRKTNKRVASAWRSWVMDDRMGRAALGYPFQSTSRVNASEFRCHQIGNPTRDT